MKRIIAIFLSLFMLLSAAPCVNAADASETFINFDLTCEGEHFVTVPTGTEITVICTLRNVPDGEAFKVRSIGAEFYFDPYFFEADKESLKVLLTELNNGFGENLMIAVTSDTAEVVGGLGDHYIQVSDFHPTIKTYENNKIYFIYKLKVKATSGQSTLSIPKLGVNYGGGYYLVKSEDLTVRVGDAPAEVYTVKYMNNGTEYKTTQASGEITVAAAPEHRPTEKEFLGWEHNGTLYQPGATFNVTGDVEFVAKWKDVVPVCNYTLTFNTNGGTTIDTFTAADGTVVDLAAYAPTKTGYTFDGWYSDAGLTNKITSVTLNGNKTVYAKWIEAVKPTFTLTFNTNGGSSINPVTKEEGTVVYLSSYNPTKAGYTFDGWYKDTALTQEVTSITLNANTTLYAKWKTTSSGDGGGGGGGTTTAKHTITFKNADGTTIESTKYESGTTVDLGKHTPEKAGYKFEGWYTEKELTNKITSIKLTKDTVLYAKWSKKDGSSSSKPGYKPPILTDEHYAYIVGREDGMIAPESDITRAEVATIIYRLLDEDERNNAKTKENVFTDVNEGDWFNTAVSTLASLELVNGRTTDTFAPNDFITRAELATIFARMVEVEYDGKVLFSDVKGHWAESYINEAATAGWIVGYNGLFRPDDNITRAEVMTLVNRVLNRQPESKADLLDGMTTWKDNADTSAWYYLAIQEATNSHKYEIKSDGVHEKWTSLTENPNWIEMER